MRSKILWRRGLALLIGLGATGALSTTAAAAGLSDQHQAVRPALVAARVTNVGVPSVASVNPTGASGSTHVATHIGDKPE